LGKKKKGQPRVDDRGARGQHVINGDQNATPGLGDLMFCSQSLDAKLGKGTILEVSDPKLDT